MKTNSISTGLAVPLLFLFALLEASAAQAAITSGVVAWGDNSYGQTTVPVEAQSGVTAIAAGTHTVALKNDGSVVAWGWNDYGQATVPVAAQSGVTAIAAGWEHTVALKTDGSVVSWGRNGNGEVTGTPTTNAPYSATASPVTLGGQVLSGVTAIAAGQYYTVALKNNGSVVAWGYNGDGQTSVPVAAQSGVTAIAAGYRHVVALKSDDSVVAWGWNDLGQTTVPLAPQSGVTAIAAGPYHTVALLTSTAPNITTQPVGQAVDVWQSASFTVMAAGYPLNYQWRKDGVDLVGATSATYSLPFAQTNQAGNYTVVVSNSAGSVTSAPPAVLIVNPVAAPGAVVAWGNNVQTTVPIAARSGVTAIAAGGYCYFSICDAHTVALKSDGSVVDWGSNGAGQTGVPIAAQSGVTAIAAGGLHTVALKNNGSVVAWGYNRDGQVTGTPTTDDPYYYYGIASPVTLEGQVLSGVTGLAAGWEHSVALKNDGSVVAWGGTGAFLPIEAQSGVTAIAAAVYRTVALKNDGSVVDQVPVPVAAQSGVTAIAAGMTHSVALKNDGTLVAWGDNYYGQVTGTPATDGYPYPATASPVTLEGQVLSGVTAIAAGWGYTVALKNDGTLVAWGDNYYGQVTGTPTTDTNYAIANPVTLEGQVLSGVTAIAAGPYHTVALIGGVQLLPSLNARPNGNELILSWPTNAVGFTLQSTLDLTPPVTWLDSTSVPAVIGAHFTLTNTASGGARFYRLRKL